MTDKGRGASNPSPRSVWDVLVSSGYMTPEEAIRMAKTKAAEAEGREQVGTVRFTRVDPKVGKVIVRVPVFEGDDPAEVERAARAAFND